MPSASPPRRHGFFTRALALPLLWLAGCGPGHDLAEQQEPSRSEASLTAAVRASNRNADFDGDGRADLAVYRPAEGKWYVKNLVTGVVTTTAWGAAGDLPIPADYDGDRRADYALWRPGDKFFYVKPANGGASFTRGPWGASGDIPVTGDFDGDRKADLALYRPSDGNWYILRSSGNWDPATTAGRLVLQVGGKKGDVPLPGDYDGDGRTDPAVWGSSALWTIKASTEGTRYCILGDSLEDHPVPEDYNGDGRTDCAIWSPDNGQWQYLASPSNSLQVSSWGGGYRPYNDRPVTGDFDNDGRADRGVIRQWGAGATDWFIARSSAGTVQSSWGTVTDKPIGSNDSEALAAAPRFQAGRVGFYSVDGSNTTNLDESTIWQAYERVQVGYKYYWIGPNLLGTNVETITSEVTAKVCDDWKNNRIDAAVFMGWSRGAFIVTEVANRTQSLASCLKGSDTLQVLGVGLIDTVDWASVSYANTLPAGVRAHHYVKWKDSAALPTRHLTGPDVRVTITRPGIIHTLLGDDPETRLNLFTNLRVWMFRVGGFTINPGADTSTRPVVAFRHQRPGSNYASWVMSILTSTSVNSGALSPDDAAWATIPGVQENVADLKLGFAEGVDTAAILENVGEAERDGYLYEGLRFGKHFVVTKAWVPQGAAAGETFLGLARNNPNARLYHNETTSNSMWMVNYGPNLNPGFWSFIRNVGGPITAGFPAARSLQLGTLNQSVNPHTMAAVRGYLPLAGDDLTRFRPALNTANQLCPSGLEGPWFGGYNPCRF